MQLWYYILQQVGKLLTGTIERPSSSDIVLRTNIKVEDAVVSIDLNSILIPFTKPPKIWIPMIPDTNSMDGVFDYGHNNILIAGADEENQEILVDNLEEGDIAVFAVKGGNPIIHRIIKIDDDDKGRYFRFKGDNNASADPYKVRDNEIRWLSIGTIY